MSLNKMDHSTVVGKQLKYKLKVNVGMVSSLVIVQVIALFLSIIGPMQGFSGMNEVEVESKSYSAYNVILFTSIWALIHAIIMTTKKDWEKSFPFVGNGRTNDLSNFLFLIGISIVAGILTILSTIMLRVYFYYFSGEYLFMTPGFVLSGQEVWTGIFIMIMHLIFMCAVGYFLGTLTRFHRLLPTLLPIILLGLLLVFSQTNSDFTMNIFQFYYQEMSATIFVLKTILSTLILFAISLFISSRTEVRR